MRLNTPDNTDIDTTHLHENEKYDFILDEATKELSESLSFLLKKIKKDLLRSDFGSIMVDDWGWRVPWLLVKKVLDKFCDKNNLNRVPITFISSWLKWNIFASKDHIIDTLSHLHVPYESQNIGQHLVEVKHNKQKILIISDFISSGSSIELFTLLLEKYNLDYTILTMWLNNKKSSKDKENKKIFSFKKGNHHTIKNIYSYSAKSPIVDSKFASNDIAFTSDFAGVTKQWNKHWINIPLRPWMKNKAWIDYNRKNTLTMRRVLPKISDEIYKNLISE